MTRSSRKLDRRIAVGVAGAGLALVGGYLMLWSPQSDRLDRATDERDRVEHELQLAQRRTLPSPSELVVDAGALQAAIPRSPELAALLRQLDAAAAATGLVLGSVGPTPPAPSPAGQAMVLTVKGSGSRAAALGFLQRLSALERVVVVEQVHLQAAAGTPDAPREGTSGEVLLELTARTFAGSAG
jgi:Tfp pilus assembly protein PilO